MSVLWARALHDRRVKTQEIKFGNKDLEAAKQGMAVASESKATSDGDLSTSSALHGAERCQGPEENA